MNNKVLYFHINPLKNEIFYVGIGNSKRPYKKLGRSKFWNNIVKKYGLIVNVIEENLNEEEAKELEMFYINKIGRRDLGKGPLVNMTDGGDGCLNLSEEHRNKIRINKTGNKYNLGKTHSEETKNKISNSIKGEKHPNYGKELNEITKNKISTSHIGKIKSEEHINSISNTMKIVMKGEGNNFYGKKHSEETKKIIAQKNGKKIIKLDKCDNIVSEYYSVSDVIRIDNITKSILYKILKNGNLYNDFKYKYKIQEDKNI